MITLPEIYNRTLYFDEPSHKYTDDLGNEYTSTTTVIHKYEIPFDKKAWSRRLAREGRGQYEGKNERQIYQQWDGITEEACDKGSAKHNNLEDNIKQHSKFKAAVKKFKEQGEKVLYTIDDIIRHKPNCKLDIDAFKESLGDRYPDILRLIDFYVSKDYELYAEVGVYHPIYLISGMIDLLAIKGDKFVIIDWKTNKDNIKFESGYYKKDKDRQLTDTWVRKNEYLKYPLDNLPNCKGSIYGMQLSTYAKQLIDRGLTCAGILLVQIRDAYILNQYGMPKTNKDGRYIVDNSKQESVEVIRMPHYKDEADLIFEHHKNTTLKHGVQYKLL